jgi:myosin heavy subunit
MRVWRNLFILAAVAAADPGDQTESAKAANVARSAANEANEVAVKSVGVTEHAQSALKVARNALRDARASAGGLSDNQKELLKSAEGELRDATLSAEYGKLQQAKWLKAKGHFVARKDTTLKKLEDKVQTVSTQESEKSELESLRVEVRRLESDLNTRTADTQATYSSNGKSDADLRNQLKDLQGTIDALETAESQGSTTSHDELKAEIESLKAAIENLEAAEVGQGDEVESLKMRLRELERERQLVTELTEERRKLEVAQAHHDAMEEAALRRELEILEARRHILEKELRQDGPMTEEALLREIHELEQRINALENAQDTGTLVYEMPPATKVPLGTLSTDGSAAGSGASGEEEEPSQDANPEETPVRESGIDIDTAMPYGELEPFGREDTAQELTESSIQESDEMVDQLERAEVAEEKRAVFRALTRLRGAAITSFDGIARSQTGNIDEYNKLHKWRRTHPLHHLADEESDISKWAFPDNADF